MINSTTVTASTTEYHVCSHSKYDNRTLKLQGQILRHLSRESNEERDSDALAALNNHYGGVFE